MLIKEYKILVQSKESKKFNFQCDNSHYECIKILKNDYNVFPVYQR